MRLSKLAGGLLLATLLTACSGTGEVAPDVPEQTLYENALEALEENDYEGAIKDLQLLEARYPFGQYSEQAQLELIYAYYRYDEPDSAIAAADRFIRLHPNHENIDYAYYLKGLTAFERDVSFVTRYLPLDASMRDPGAALDSFESFSVLLNRYPESQYTPDARKRMVHLRNRLADYEVQVARHYMRRGAWVAAANRGRYVVENMQNTPATAEALAIMADAYTELGLREAAERSRAVLKANFPDFKYVSVKPRDPSLLQTVTFGLLGSDDDSDAPVTEMADEEESSFFDTITFGLFSDDKDDAEAK